jgi:hypothetical protein
MESEHTETSSEPPRRPVLSLSKRKKLLFASLVLFACYATAELVMTILYMQGILSPALKSTVVLEEASQYGSTRFDPIRGCYLTPHPARTAIVASNGRIETVGVVRGNNQGFPDRDDFQVKRGAGASRRYAVFGDSMTAAQFLARNWPDTTEDMAGDSQQPLELYNFSIFGGGLDNWKSVIVDHLDAEEYELDGVIFAVCCDDLHRAFTFWDDSQVQIDSQGRKFASYGRIPSRDKLDRPANLAQASLFISPINWRLLSSNEFDRLLAGETRLAIDREFKLYLTSRCVAGLAQLGGGGFEPDSQVSGHRSQLPAIYG